MNGFLLQREMQPVYQDKSRDDVDTALNGKGAMTLSYPSTHTPNFKASVHTSNCCLQEVDHVLFLSFESEAASVHFTKPAASMKRLYYFVLHAASVAKVPSSFTMSTLKAQHIGGSRKHQRSFWTNPSA
jgi:hypothetical protein